MRGLAAGASSGPQTLREGGPGIRPASRNLLIHKEDQMDKQKALAVFDSRSKDGKSLVYARREEIEDIPQQYEPLITVCEFDQSDFINMGKDNFYPPKPIVNQISDATGVSFISKNCGTRVKGDWSKVTIVQHKDGSFEALGDYGIIGYAQGYRTKADGTPRKSNVCEYEFNVTDRCNTDYFWGNYPPKNMQDARKKLYEVKKFATRRASTGAELAVIRELAGVPTGFKSKDLGKPMVFSQVIESNRYKLGIAAELMKTPDGRNSLAQAMFGTSQTLFGPGQAQDPADMKDVSPDTPDEPEKHEPAEDDIFPAAAEETESEKPEDQIRELKTSLEEYLLDPDLKLSANTITYIKSLINNDKITVKELAEAIASIEDYKQKKQGGAA